MLSHLQFAILKIVRVPRWILDRFGNLLVIPIFWSFFWLRYPTLRKAEVVVVMQEGGFGHTITGPDLTRRVFSGRRCVFIAFSSAARHNLLVASIWPNLKLVFIPISIPVVSIGKRTYVFNYPKRLRPATNRAIRWLVRLVAEDDCVFLSMHELYARLGAPQALHEMLPTSSAPYFPAYFRLQREVPVPPLRLPEHQRHAIRGRLADVAASSREADLPVCCLYLRQKGAMSDDISTRVRVGSPLQDYLPAIRLLNEAGYQVLVVGDVPVPKHVYDTHAGMLVDTKNLRISWRAFSIYAATEATIFIGESGGGVWLPTVNNIPILLINAFPYFVGLPHSWVHYKTVTDDDGRLVHYRKLFSDHAYDYELEGMKLHNNSRQEILEAVKCFLEDIANPLANDPHADALAFAQDHTWLKQSNARLSPSWLRLYDERIAVSQDPNRRANKSQARVGSARLQTGKLD